MAENPNKNKHAKNRAAPVTDSIHSAAMESAEKKQPARLHHSGTDVLLCKKVHNTLNPAPTSITPNKANISRCFFSLLHLDQYVPKNQVIRVNHTEKEYNKHDT